MGDFENHTYGRHKPGGEGAKWTGIILILIGLAFLGRNLIPDFPRWLFRWEMILITIGLLVGIRHQFKGIGWFIMVAIGSISMLDLILPIYNKPQFTWATIAIAIGVYLIMKPKPKVDYSSMHQPGDYQRSEWHTHTPSSPPPAPDPSASEAIDATSIFASVKKVIVSKDFRGGEVVAIMGGAEIDLSKADIKGTVRLDATNIMGGTELIVPPTWEVKSNVVAILGGVEDKRDPRFLRIEPDKVLILEGLSLFGGIEIKSY